jgi:hypothetical protein
MGSNFWQPERCLEEVGGEAGWPPTWTFTEEKGQLGWRGGVGRC